MAEAPKLKWKNASAENPGYTVWHSTPERDEDILYVIRRKKPKRGVKPIGWRVFMRSSKTDQLRTIYLAQKNLEEAKTFVQEWEEMICAANAIESAPTP